MNYKVLTSFRLLKRKNLLVSGLLSRSTSTIGNVSLIKTNRYSVQQHKVPMYKSGAIDRIHSVCFPTPFDINATRQYHKNISENMNPIATYEEVKDIPNHPEKILIDVREPKELVELGEIPSAINIPLGNVEQELKLSSEDFLKKYGRKKPNSSTEIIFFCMIGGRSQKATSVALSLGFEHARNYKGSWVDWAEKEGLAK